MCPACSASLEKRWFNEEVTFAAVRIEVSLDPVWSSGAGLVLQNCST